MFFLRVCSIRLCIFSHFSFVCLFAWLLLFHCFFNHIFTEKVAIVVTSSTVAHFQFCKNDDYFIVIYYLLVIKKKDYLNTTRISPCLSSTTSIWLCSMRKLAYSSAKNISMGLHISSKS